jgi:hypothetical protein
MIVGIAAIAFFLISSAELRAQSSKPYLRGVCIEEFTGTWCGYCPRGAWFMDSLQEYMGDNVIEICWHNNYSQPGNDDPNNGGDPMTIDLDQTNKVEDTIESYFGVTGFPNVGVMRSGAIGIGDWNPGDPIVSSNSKLSPGLKIIAQTAPLADFRIVNVAYNPSNNTLSADMDVTPYDLSKMPSEDKTKYNTIAVVTEDGLDYDQHNYGLHGLPDWISPFTHQNVARQVGGKVTGNVFTLGTQSTSPTFPVRIHYTFTLNSSWMASNLRLKGILDGIKDSTVGGKKFQFNTVFNAGQTKYFNSYPTSAPDAAWVVLPSASSVIQPNVPTNIVWATGGSIGNSVKLEYTIDDGKTWAPVVANTSQSPYAWNMPKAAYGTTAKVRATAGSASGISEGFKTPGIVTISKPAAGDIIDGGSDYTITYSGGNLKTPLRFEYSVDNGTTWTVIGNLGFADGTSYDWSSVFNPTTDAPQSLVRITDGNSIVGTSGIFTIKANASIGSINTVTVAGLIPNTPPNSPSIAANTATTITWTTNGGNVGTKLIVESSLDFGQSWQTVNNSVDPAATSVNWTTPSGDYPDLCLVRVRSADADKLKISKESDVFSIVGGSAGISGLKIKDLDLTKMHIAGTINTTISWIVTGTVGLGIRVQYSEDNSTWKTIGNGSLGPKITSTTWQTPATYVPAAYIRVISADADKSNLFAQLGPFSIDGIDGVNMASSNGYSISNYPNPFGIETKIKFELPTSTSVTLSVRDELGREISKVVTEKLDAGSHEMPFSASKLSNGVYTYTLEAGTTKLVGKMSVVK